MQKVLPNKCHILNHFVSGVKRLGHIRSEKTNHDLFDRTHNSAKHKVANAKCEVTWLEIGTVARKDNWL